MRSDVTMAARRANQSDPGSSLDQLELLMDACRYTGYPMWLIMTVLQREGKPWVYLRSLLLSWTGSLVGALFTAAVFTYSTQSLTEEPWKSGVIRQVRHDIIDARWHVIFIKAIACGFLVR